MTADPAPPVAQPAKRRHISWRKRLVFVVLGIALFVPFLELSCYVGLKLTSKLSVSDIHNDRERELGFDRDTELAPAEVAHPYLGWTRNPLTKRPDLFEGRKYDPNEFGLMDVGSPLRKRAPGKVIVAVTGGSVGWQMTVSGEDTFLRELKKQPRFQNTEVELVRLAVSGYKQPQQLMLLTYLLSLGAEFDILVNIDGYNEVALHPAENGKGNIFPPYPRAWKVRKVDTVNPTHIRTINDFLNSKRAHKGWRAWFSTLPFQKSATVNFLWLVLDTRYVAAEAELNMQILQGRLDDPGYQILGPRKTFADDAEMFEYLVNYWAECSRNMDRICQINKIEYHHVLPPNQHLNGSKPIVDPEEQKIALLDSEYSRAAATGYPLLVEKGKELSAQGLKFHDLTQLFAKNTEPIYVDDCCHYNPSGNERLAAAVAEIIGKKPR